MGGAITEDDVQVKVDGTDSDSYSFDIIGGNSYTQEIEILVFEEVQDESLDIQTDIIIDGDVYEGNMINTSHPNTIEPSIGSNLFEVTTETSPYIRSTDVTIDTEVGILSEEERNEQEQNDQESSGSSGGGGSSGGSSGSLPIIDGGEDENNEENEDQNQNKREEDNQNDNIDEESDNNQTEEQKPSLSDVIEDPINSSSDIKQGVEFLDNPRSMTVLNMVFISISGLVLVALTII